MKDPEFVLLRNHFLIGLVIIILFDIPIIIFLSKLTWKDSNIMKKLNNKDTMIILVIEDNCRNCKIYKKVLENNKISYQLLNKYKERDYDLILKKIDTSKDDIIPPTILYVEEGKLISSLVDIKEEEELTTFLENYKLIKEGRE